MQNKIKCPYCDCEYLPGEIYLPKHFLGQPKDIERDYAGVIIWNNGIEANPNETFICQKCNKQFKINAKIEYNITKCNENNTDLDYISEKYKNRLILSEN